MSYPTLETCDQDDPKQAFQWALISLPFAGSTPLIVQPEVRPEWSQLFHDLGFRHHPELQVKKIVPPVRGQQTALNGAALVLDMDEEPPTGGFVQDPATMTAHEAEFQLELHRRQGTLRDTPPEVDGASVVNDAELFNPADHTVSSVNVYLANPWTPHYEKMRVMAVEMGRKGGPRQGILRKNPGL